MTTLREAAKQALEFIKVTNASSSFWLVPESNLNKTVKALRAALEQPEQEPVAWQWLNTAHFRKKLPADAEPGAWNPLYTHPPRREWRGLTEEEKRECAQAMDAEPLAEGWPELVKFARAIETALKEKNSA